MMSKKPTKFHFDSTDDDTHTTETSKTYTTVTGVDPYNLGYNNAVEEIQKYLKALGEALCVILEMVPNRQVSVVWNVSEDCELRMTISKEV